MIRLGLLEVTVKQPESPGPSGHMVAPEVGPTTGVNVMVTGTSRPWPTVALETARVPRPVTGVTVPVKV